MALQYLILRILENMKSRCSCGQPVEPAFPLYNSYLQGQLKGAYSSVPSEEAVGLNFIPPFLHYHLALCLYWEVTTSPPSVGSLSYSKYLCMVGDIFLSQLWDHATSGLVPYFCFFFFFFDHTAIRCLFIVFKEGLRNTG